MANCRRKVTQSVFGYLDEDGDGKISFGELMEFVVAVRGKEVVDYLEVEEMVKSLDSDGDGWIGLDDLVRLIEEQGDLHDDEEKMVKELKEAFEMYLIDGYECITPRSLKSMLGQLGQSKTIDECVVMINQFDLNGDGVLSFDEFKIMMT